MKVSFDKMQKLAIIGASYLQLPLVKKAKEMGMHTLCFAWQEGTVCKDPSDEYYPISVVEKEQILGICQDQHVDGVCTIASDVAAPTVAYVAEKMGLVCNSYETAVMANNKFMMRNAFSKAGVPCPKYQKISSLNEIDKDWAFPLIVKPIDRSGSLGITKVERSEDLIPSLKDALRYSFKHEAIVEEFIEGREISVEFISYQGKHYPLQITDKVTTGAPHFVELEHHQPAELSDNQYKEIYALTVRALDALGVTNGASHSEYKITEDGCIYVMEIGARMGGDFIGSDLVVENLHGAKSDKNQPEKGFSNNAPAGTRYNLGYLLEHGTAEHAIPNAFGRGYHWNYTDSDGNFYKGTLEPDWHPGSKAVPHYKLALIKNKKVYKESISEAWR